MNAPGPFEQSSAPLGAEERRTLEQAWQALQESGHPQQEELLDLVARHVERSGELSSALHAFPLVFEEQTLGRRRRDLDTLVDLLEKASDADFDLFQPTRASIVRALVLARLNLWRLLRYLADECFGEDHAELQEAIDARLHACVYEKLTEELLASVCMESGVARTLRRLATADLVSLWDDSPSEQVRAFFPLLEATWEARRRLRVSVGTLLGVSEIMRLLQAGCAQEFVAYFSRTRLSKDEGMAFQEFLIGVSSEQLHSLEQLLEDTGRYSLSPEEAEEALGLEKRREQGHLGVSAYHFYRERYLQAAARRIRNLPGPKHTAEEYMLLYYLENRAAAAQA